MYEKRIQRLALAFGCLGLLLFVGVCYRMVVQREHLAATPFIQQSELERIHTLARENIITRDKQGRVRVDYQALRDRHGARFTDFVKKREKFLSFNAKGELEIQRDAVKVTNRRTIRASTLAGRGRILDRRGRVLAESRQGKNGKWQRVYPYGAAALPVVGAVHRLYGERGLEHELSGWLTGKEQTSGTAGLYRLFSGRKKQGEARLTIDAEVQKAAYKALGKQTGAIVVVDVRTGAIIAAASTPSLDPNRATDADWQRAAELKYRAPFINRGLQRRYPPGSTFKIVTATAVIDKKGFRRSSGLTCRGIHPKYGIRDYHNKRHGWVGLDNAFKLSCNVYFGEAAVRLGPELLQKAELFGFNHAWNLIGRKGAAPTARSLAFAGYKKVRSGGRWQAADFRHNPKLVARGGIGQTVVSATPLQMALAGAAIANRGVLMEPFIVDRVTFAADKGGSEGIIDWWHNSPKQFAQVCRKKSAREILKMMQLVMHKGTGFALPKLNRVKGGYKLFAVARKGQKNLLAGKTGTAETGRGDHSWFVAVAPVDHPRYAVAAIVEYGGLGAKAAGKAAVRTMLAALNADGG